MKNNLIKMPGIICLIAMFLGSCSNNKSDMEIQPKAPQQATTELTAEQKQAMQLQADKIVRENLTTLKGSSKNNLRDALPSEVLETDIVGISNCTFSLYTYVRSFSSLDATGQATFTSSFCAQPGHLRYGVIYFIDNSGIKSVGGVSGPTGGCLSGSAYYSVTNVANVNDGFAQIVVFDVLTTGPSNGPVFVNILYSNPRHLECFGPSY